MLALLGLLIICMRLVGLLSKCADDPGSPHKWSLVVGQLRGIPADAVAGEIAMSDRDGSPSSISSLRGAWCPQQLCSACERAKVPLVRLAQTTRLAGEAASKSFGLPSEPDRAASCDVCWSWHIHDCAYDNMDEGDVVTAHEGALDASRLLKWHVVHVFVEGRDDGGITCRVAHQ